MTLFHSEALSNAKRFSLRFGFALVIPALIVLALLYLAAAQEKNLNDRNLRWLAQMAAQIHDRVQNHSNLVRDRAAKASAALAATDALYSIDTVKPESGPCIPEKWGHLSVVDGTQERQIRFTHSKGERKVCAYSYLRELVEPALRKDAFTSVVLAQRNGKVLYQSGPERLRITNVSFLFVSPVAGPILNGVKGGEADTRVEPPTASVHLNSLIGDTKYSVFVQPLPMILHAESGAKDSDWLLIGLLEDRTLLPSAAPNDVMVLLPIALLLAAVSWPLHKLWTLSPLDPLRPFQIAAIAVCSLVVIVVLTLLSVSEYLRHTSTIRADRQLSGFADALGKNFKDELQLAIEQLYALDKIAVAMELGGRPNLRSAGSGPQTKVSILANFLKPTDVHLPFEFADWIDGQGEKNIRWTTGDVALQALKVADRTYFKDVISGEMLTIAGRTSTPFAIEQVLSRTSGHAVTMIAVPSQSRVNPVASLAANFQSITNPVAPRDLGFAIIDPTGKVLFHSQGSNMFVENFFDECGESKALRGLVSRRVPAYLDVDYGANPHRIFVTPIPDLQTIPWTMITFRKLSANRVGRMQVLTDTSLLLLAYGISLSSGAWIAFRLAQILVRLRRRSLSRRWIAWQGGYPCAAVGGLVLIVILWRAFERLHGSQLFTAAVAGAVSFLLVTALAARRPIAAGDWNSPQGRRRLLTLAGIPAVLCALSAIVGDRLLVVLAPGIAFALLLLLKRVTRSPHRRTLRNTAWLLWGAQLALALCVGPTLMLSRMSFEYEMRLRLRDSQWRLWDAEGRRHHSVLRTIEAIPRVPRGSSAGEEHGKDMLERLLAPLRLPKPDLAQTPIYYYGSATSRVSLREVPNDLSSRSRSSGPRTDVLNCPASNPGSRNVGHAVDTSLLGSLLAAVELPNEDDRLIGFNARQRTLEPSDNLWSWYEQDRLLCMYSNRQRVAQNGPLAASAEPLVAQTPLPEFHPLRESVVMSMWPGWSTLIALLSAGAFWMVKVRDRLLLKIVTGTGSAGDLQYAPGTPLPRRLFLLVQPGCSAADLPFDLSSYSRVDLATQEFRLDSPGSMPASGLLLEHFESRFSDPALRSSRLNELETAIRVSDKPIAIVSSIDCVRYVAGLEGSEGTAENIELSRWYAVLAYFDRWTLPSRATNTDCHAAIWETCSDQEKIVLGHVSRYGVVNPRSVGIVSGLLERGLLCRTRDFRICFSSVAFRAFVASVRAPVRRKGAGLTTRQRLPAYAIGLVLLGFILFVSQEEVTTRLIGFLTTVTGGFEAIRKQLAGVQGDFGGSKKG